MQFIRKFMEKYKKHGFFGLVTVVVMKLWFVRLIKHKIILRYLKTRYAYVIAKYKNTPPPVSRITHLNLAA